MSKDVVITGLGSVCGFGVGPEVLWDGLDAGETCLRPIERFDASGFEARLAAEVPDFSAKSFVPKSYRKAVKIMARDTELAVAAASGAIESAGLVTRATDPEAESTYPAGRIGCHIGAGLIAADTDELSRALQTSRDASGDFDIAGWGGSGESAGMDNLTPLWMLKYLPNMLACHVTILHGAEGPSNTITCCEASGLLSIGESVRVIRRGAADCCFSGGAESKVSLMGLARMEMAGRLAPTGDATRGDTLLAPFDPTSPGTLPGEGAGILVLERPDSAAARDASVIGRIIGIGSAQSDPDYAAGADDEGMRYAIENALADAGVAPDGIDAVVPLGCGIPALDTPEYGAISAVFGSRASDVPLIACAPALGNCMAGAGGLQAAIAIDAMARQRLPVHQRGGRRVPSTGAELGTILCCAPSLGGQNAAIVITVA